MVTQIIVAFAIDTVLGEPCTRFHPVCGMGKLAYALERSSRKLVASPFVAGVITAVSMVSICGFVAWSTLWVMGSIHPWLASVTDVLLVYCCISPRSLAEHAMAVYYPLVNGNVAQARKQVANIVGRDTTSLDERGITRATVETVAENIVDGITAPLFFAIIFGPVGAVVYRAVNTLDSQFGYKNDRYIQFGWASARLDDLLNYLPARFSAVCVSISAYGLRMSAQQSLVIWWRDRNNHLSPNSGNTEAAVAGALGIQLGGDNVYFNQVVSKPTIGDPTVSLSTEHIIGAIKLMYGSSLVFCLLFLFAFRVVSAQ